MILLYIDINVTAFFWKKVSVLLLLFLHLALKYQRLPRHTQALRAATMEWKITHLRSTQRKVSRFRKKKKKKKTQKRNRKRKRKKMKNPNSKRKLRTWPNSNLFSKLNS